MNKKLSTALFLLLAIFHKQSIGGLRQTNFLETRYKGRSVVVPVFSNQTCAGYKWNNFINDRPIATQWKRNSDGTETGYVLSRSSMSIRAASTGIQFSTLFQGPDALKGVTDFRIDDDGDYFMLLPKSDGVVIQWRPKSKNYAIEYSYSHYVDAAGFGVLYDWIGGIKKKYLYIACTNGQIVVIDLAGDKKALTRYITPIPTSGKTYQYATSDGYANNGTFDIFLASYEDNSISRVSLNLSERNSSILDIPITITGTPKGFQPGHIPTLAPIVSVNQFWVGEDDWRLLLRLQNGNIFSADRDGRVIEAALVTSENGENYNVQPQPIDKIYSLATCNTRRSYAACSDILMFEDFSKSGHGIHRLEWTPDGYLYNLPLQVYMKDVSTEANISKPVLYIKNASTWRSATGIKIRIWHSRAELPSQSMKSELYYSSISGVTVSDGIDSTNGNITYTELTFPSSFELPPGESTALDGLQLGIHFNGYYPGVWDKLNDWSWNNPPNLGYTLNGKVTVYAENINGTIGLVQGTPPPENYVAAPKDIRYDNFTISDDPTIWNYPLGVFTSTSRTSGNWGMAIPVNGYNELKTLPFKGQWSNTQYMSIDLLYGPLIPNPYWIGAISASIDCPSLNIWSVSLGNVNLSGFLPNRFNPMRFTIPPELRSKMSTYASDWVVRFSVNGPTGSSAFIVDNLRIY